MRVKTRVKWKKRVETRRLICYALATRRNKWRKFSTTTTFAPSGRTRLQETRKPARPLDGPAGFCAKEQVGACGYSNDRAS